MRGRQPKKDKLGSGEVVASHFSYTAYFEQEFPLALSIGMTYGQYWNGDPHLISYYWEAEQIRRKQENQRLWLQGAYVYEAISDFVEFYAMQPRAKAKPYTKEPYPLTEIEMRERKEKERIEKIENIKKKMFMKMQEIRKGGNNGRQAD